MHAQLISIVFPATFCIKNIFGIDKDCLKNDFPDIDSIRHKNAPIVPVTPGSAALDCTSRTNMQVTKESGDVACTLEFPGKHSQMQVVMRLWPHGGQSSQDSQPVKSSFSHDRHGNRWPHARMNFSAIALDEFPDQQVLLGHRTPAMPAASVNLNRTFRIESDRATDTSLVKSVSGSPVGIDRSGMVSTKNLKAWTPHQALAWRVFE